MAGYSRVAHLRKVKAAGILPGETWKAIEEGVKKSGMAPSGQAMTLAEWFVAFKTVYGVRAARKFTGLAENVGNGGHRDDGACDCIACVRAHGLPRERASEQR